jgi:hypothetical protein
MGVVASLDTRVLVRLSETLPSTVDGVNEALGTSLVQGNVASPGVAATVSALEALARRGLAVCSDEGWLLTPAGAAQYYTLESRFENSGQRGDYGF